MSTMSFHSGQETDRHQLGSQRFWTANATNERTSDS
jgi:hypothetical protein